MKPPALDGPDLETVLAMGERDAVKTRLREFAKSVGGLEVVAAKAGASKSTVYRLAQEGAGNIETLWKIGRAWTISTDWLLFGRTPSAQGRPLGDDYTLVDRYDVRAAAVDGALAKSEHVVERIAFRTEWIDRRFRRHASKLACIEADGDSMAPTIGKGDLLLIDRAETTTRRDGVYVLRTPAGMIVKRVQLRHDGSIELRADNPAYENEHVPRTEAQQLEVIGRVVWRGGSV